MNEMCWIPVTLSQQLAVTFQKFQIHSRNELHALLDEHLHLHFEGKYLS